MSATARLYWDDPYRTSFSARVLGHVKVDGRPAVVLDRTYFYPTSGGQPHDTGQLNGVAVIDVVENDEEIVHVLATPLTGDTVEGTVDWPRRRDHMQQHAGQHVLSAAFEQVMGAATVSFHLGAETCTIDLDVDALAPVQLDAVEDCANATVLANTPIGTAQYSPAELEAVRLRKAPSVEGLVRVVSVGEFDHSACGGTHPAFSGEIGMIHIDRWERRHGGVRVTFLCGDRAMRDYREQNRICHELATGASVAISELPAAYARLVDALAEARKQADDLGTQILDYQARALQGEAVSCGPYRVVARRLQGLAANQVRSLAQTICEAPGTVAILVAGEPVASYVMTRAADVALDMPALMRAIAGPYGGRGGGQSHLVQGGGLAAEDADKMLADSLQYIAASNSSATGEDSGR